MWIQLSRPAFGGGPARTLSRPTRAALSDGPFRYRRFRLHRIRKDFHNVLVVGDVAALTTAASEVLAASGKGKHDGFWSIFAHRIRDSMHLLRPSDVAIIAESFTFYHKTFGLYPLFTEAVLSKIKEVNGKTLMSLLRVFSKDLKAPLYSKFYSSLSNTIPNFMFELSVDEIVKILNFLSVARIKDLVLCRRTAQKVMAHLNQVDAQTIGNVSSAFSSHGYRDIVFYSRIKDRASEISDTFDKDALYNLLKGFYELEIEASEILLIFSERVIGFSSEFSRVQLILLKDLVDRCDGDTLHLHKALVAALNKLQNL